MAKLEQSNADVHNMVSGIAIQFMPYILSIRPRKAEERGVLALQFFYL